MEQRGSTWMRSLEQATAAYEEGLASSSQAAEYLAARGLDDNAVRTARLGVVSNPQPGHEQFQGMISIPYQTPSGVVALKFRRLDNGTPKYTAPLGQRTRMYNVMALKRATDTVAVCEGELDALVLDQMVGVPSVGVSGANNWKDHFPRMLRGFQNILIVTDNDIEKDNGANPGQELATRILGTLPYARNIVLPTGMDVNDFFLAEGREAFLRRLGVESPI